MPDRPLSLGWALDYARTYWQHGGEPQSQAALTVLARAVQGRIGADRESLARAIWPEAFTSRVLDDDGEAMTAEAQAEARRAADRVHAALTIEPPTIPRTRGLTMPGDQTTPGADPRTSLTGTVMLDCLDFAWQRDRWGDWRGAEGTITSERLASRAPLTVLFRPDAPQSATAPALHLAMSTLTRTLDDVVSILGDDAKACEIDGEVDPDLMWETLAGGYVPLAQRQQPATGDAITTQQVRDALIATYGTDANVESTASFLTRLGIEVLP